MAKIILQVDASINNAKKSIGELKQNVDSLAKSFNNVKANKDLTEQIKALTQWNKSLADAVEKTTKVNNQNKLAEEKLAQARAKTVQATEKARAATEKATREEIKNAEATGKVLVQQEKVEQAKIKTATAEIKLAGAIKKTTEETDKQEEKAKGLIETLMQFSITSKLIHSGINMIRNAVKDMNETLADTEKRIIAIQRVLPEGSVSDRDLTNRLYDLAIEYGQSFANVSDIATEFARTGISYADTIEATRAALLALNVAELDTAQATEGMIAIMAQFGLSAEKMNDVVDALNKTADRFPVTTEKLMAALQRMGSSASIAGLTLEQTIGVATALSKATGRSGANVGTAANALIQYASKPKALDVYAELSPEMADIVHQYRIGAANILDIWKGLSKEINNLTVEQADKLDVLANYFETDEGKDLQSQLEDELGEIQNDITGVFATANTFRKNYFIALLQNLDTVEEAAETARDAQGYSIKENEKEMQTYERRVQALEEHWHKLANDEQGWLAFRKGLVEIGDITLSVMEWTGGLRTAVIALGTVFGLTFGQKVVSQIRAVITSITSMTTATEGAAVAAGTLSTAWQGVFAIVGLAITAISSLIGFIDKYNAEQHQANLSAIETWKQSKNNVEQLQELYAKYKDLTPQSKDFQQIEEQIVKVLGEKATVLGTLTKGTKEYTEALKKLTEQELFDHITKTSVGAAAAADEVANIQNYRTALGANKANIMVLQALGLVDNLFDYESATAAESGRVFGNVNKLLDWNNSKDASLKNYFTTQGYVEKIRETAHQKTLAGDMEGAQLLLQSFLYEEMVRYLAENESTIQNYLETHTAKYLNEFFATEGKTGINSDEDYRKALIYVYRAFDKNDANVDLYKDKIEGILKLYSRISDTVASVDSGTGRAANNYSDIVKGLNDLLSTNQEVNNEIEKQNKLLEAQEKLGNAIAKARADYIKNQLQAYLDGLKAESDIADKRESIDDARLKVEEARLKVEEKRKNVKQAEYELAKAQELLNRAREERNVRVYNELTGSFELQANKKNVESAQEKVRQATEKVEGAVLDVDNSIKDVENAEKNVEKAINSLQDYLKNKAIDEIKAAIENGNATESEIDGIFNKWFGNGGGAWGDAIKKVISEASGKSYFEIYSNETVMAAKQAVETAKQALDTVRADQFYSSLADLYGRGSTVTDKELNALIAEYKNKGLSQASINTALSLIDSILNPTTPDTKRREIVHGKPYDDGGRAPIYDKGGILSGMGGIKATSEPELIIDPELTKRILSPTSNGAFERFASELGVLYGNPARDRPRPVYTNNWNTATSSDNRSYNINGVPIPRDAAQKYTIAELFDNMVLV